MSLTDALNLPGDELFWINRTALHNHYCPPLFCAYDLYRNIRQTKESQGWIIDYCHCPLETAFHPNKDCSEAQLRQRLETFLSEGGEAVWCAVPEEALIYHLMRRHARIAMVGWGNGKMGDYNGEIESGASGDDDNAQSYRIALPDLPVQVPYQSLTLEVGVPAAWCRDPRVTVDGQEQSAEVLRPGVLRVTTLVQDGTEIEVPATRLSY